MSFYFLDIKTLTFTKEFLYKYMKRDNPPMSPTPGSTGNPCELCQPQAEEGQLSQVFLPQGEESSVIPGLVFLPQGEESSGIPGFPALSTLGWAGCEEPWSSWSHHWCHLSQRLLALPGAPGAGGDLGNGAGLKFCEPPNSGSPKKRSKGDAELSHGHKW